MKAHHIGYIVKNIVNAKEEFEALGYEIIQDICFDNLRKMQVCFLHNNGFVVELVSPDKDCSCIGGGLRKLGNAPYHICYEVDDLVKAVSELQQNSYLLVQDIALAPALENGKVAFLFNEAIGLIELFEKR